MRPKGKENKIRYNVRLDAEPLRQIKIIGAVEGKPASQLIRNAIRKFVNEWHQTKRASVLEREKDFKEMKMELNGWTGSSGEKWIEVENEVWL